ncbi:sugar porter family MFS transporter [Bauldia sp.]|uniref:sugar porter family MFS transporter n=1 Tax=Bauldia sp. TaxID=2575872 RepID=UPI003BA8C40C
MQTESIDYGDDAGARRLFLLRLVVVAALGGLLFGYDTAVVSGAIIYVRQDFNLSAAAVGWTVSAALVGAAFGAAFAGRASDRFGRKLTLIVAAILFLGTAIGSAMADSLALLLIMRAIGGIGVGIVSVVSPLYLSEVAPARLRGGLVSTYQLALTVGMLLVYLVNYLIATSGTVEWDIAYGWRWMFASQAVPAAILLGALLTVPESPRWLFFHGQRDKAAAILKRILAPTDVANELHNMGDIQDTHETRTGSRYSPAVRRIVVIGVLLAVFQQVSGINVLLYFAPQIFETVTGAGADFALLETIIIGVANLTFTLVALFTVDKFGRRILMLIGFAIMGICIAIIGVAIYLNAVGPLLILLVIGYVAGFAVAVGPVTWVILSEIFPARIRGTAVGIALMANWLANVAVSQTFAQMDSNAWLIAVFNHAFPFLLYAGFCLLAVIFVYRFIPETKGRSLEDIEASELGGQSAT